MGEKPDEVSRRGQREERARDASLELRRETEPYYPGQGEEGLREPEHYNLGQPYFVGRGREPEHLVRERDYSGRPVTRDHWEPGQPRNPTGHAGGPDEPVVVGGPVTFRKDYQPGRAESAEDIRRRIHRTRAEMDETIHALRDRLEPAHLREQAGEAVRDATIGRARHMAEEISDMARQYSKHYKRSMLSTIKDNPIPAALAGVGLGWLIMSGRSSWRPMQPRKAKSGGEWGMYYSPEEHTVRYTPMAGDESFRELGPERAMSDEERTYLGYEGRYSSGGWDQGEGVGQRGRSSSEGSDYSRQASEYAHQAQDTASRYADTARQRASQYASSASDYAHQAMDTASRYARQAGDYSGELMHSARESMPSSPILLAALALGAGVVVGLALPESRWESQMLGQSRDRAMDRAQSMGQEAMHRAKSAAYDAAAQARQTFTSEMQGQERRA